MAHARHIQHDYIFESFLFEPVLGNHMRATAIGISLSGNEHKPTDLSCTSQSAGVRQVGCWIIVSVGIAGRQVEVDAANAQSAGKQISVSDTKHARDPAAT